MGESACAHVGGRAATLIASTAPFRFLLICFCFCLRRSQRRRRCCHSRGGLTTAAAFSDARLGTEKGRVGGSEREPAQPSAVEQEER